MRHKSSDVAQEALGPFVVPGPPLCLRHRPREADESFGEALEEIPRYDRLLVFVGVLGTTAIGDKGGLELGFV